MAPLSPSGPQKKLPVAKILFGAFSIPGGDRITYLRALLIPAIGLIAVMLMWRLAVLQQIEVSSWQLYIVYSCLFSLFAVACHRLVLLPPYTQNDSQADHSFHRILRFFGWMVFIYLVYMAIFVSVTMVLGTALLNVISASREDESRAFQLVQLIAAVPATYVLGRLSLVLPATAIDKQVDLRWSWDRTRENGWRLVIVVGILPWALSSIPDTYNFNNLSVLGAVFLIVISVALYAVEIVALSLSYWELRSGPTIESSET